MKRALLIIDVQNDYVDGNLRIAYPEPAMSLAAIGEAADAARAAGIPVVVVQTVLPETSPIFARNTWGAALCSVVGERPMDLLVTKTLPSCLAETELRQWLEARSIDTLTLVGYMTHNCIDATARHACHLGYGVEVLSDATGSIPYLNAAGGATAKELHRVSLTALEARFARVLSSAEWRSGLSSSDVPKPTGIWQSNRNALMQVAP